MWVLATVSKGNNEGGYGVFATWTIAVLNRGLFLDRWTGILDWILVSFVLGVLRFYFRYTEDRRKFLIFQKNCRYRNIYRNISRY